MGNGITHLHLLGVLDTRDDIAHVACTQFLTRNHVHLQHTNLVGIILHAGIEELHVVARMDHAIDDLKIGNDTTEGIEHRVEDQSLQRSLFITFGMRDALYHSIEYLLDTLARLTRGTDDV